MASVGDVRTVHEVVLKDRNGDKFTCAVESSVDESSICLTNTVTNTRWMCKVDTNNLEGYYHTGNFELACHHRIVMALLQDVYQRNIKRMGSSGSSGLYCMELRLACWINVKENCWVFPMTPEDPVAILKRQKELDEAAKA